MTKAEKHHGRQIWILVSGLGIVMGIIFGITLNAFSILTLPLMEDFHSTQAETAHGSSIFILTMTLVMPLAGWLLDRISPRLIMVSGAVVTGIGYSLAAQSQTLDTFIIGMAVCGAGVGISTYIPAFTLVAHWVAPIRQGLFFGIMLAITSLGGIFFPLVLTSVISDHGWRVAMRIGIALIFLVCIPLLWWVVRLPGNKTAVERSEKKASSSGYAIKAALQLPIYWVWALSFFMITLSSLGILMGLVPYLKFVGYTSQSASMIYASIAAATVIGSLLFGFLSTRYGPERTFLGGLVVNTAGLLFLFYAGTAHWGLGAALGFSLTWGTTFNLANQLAPTLLLKIVGDRNFGSLLGIGNLISGIGAALGPIVFSHFVDTTGNYVISLVISIGLLLASIPFLGIFVAKQKTAA